MALIGLLLQWLRLICRQVLEDLQQEDTRKEVAAWRPGQLRVSTSPNAVPLEEHGREAGPLPLIGVLT